MKTEISKNTNKIAKKVCVLIGMTVLLASCGEKNEPESNKQNYEKNEEQQFNSNKVNTAEKKVVPQYWPALEMDVKADETVEKRVASLLSEMTLAQKVAQMIQPEIRDITPEDMRKYGFGSYLNGGGSFPGQNKHSTPQDWISYAEDMYQASIDDSLDGSKIPTMWGTDAVHGHNNVIGATLFPHNIGLGAANNPQLIEQVAAATATEVMVTGIEWVFAPTVAVVRDDRWGRTYEGYSEDPDIVREYAAAVVKGLQGSINENFLDDKHVISTVKHFLGDGGTEGGDDQGNNIATEEDLFNIHAQGYVGGLAAGAQSVMASFNSWHGKKNHGNKYLLTDILKDRMGFDGFVVGDWNGHGQVAGCTNESCPQSVNAGLDMFMVPTGAWKPLYENTIAQVNSGEISLSRIDDAVSRILRVKVRAGLFEKPSPANRPLSGKIELIGNEKHRAIARKAVRESLVLLKNNNNTLPISPTKNILITGDGANNIGKQSGGWTITWQGTGNTNEEFPGGTSIYAGIESVVSQAGGKVQLSSDGTFNTRPDIAIVVFGEEPYAEGNGDLNNLEYQRGNKKDLALLKSLKAKGIPVVSVFISGRPMFVNAELNTSDAFVAAWLPGSEGQGIADVILSKQNGKVNHDFVGKLSFSWPKSPNQTKVNRNDKDYDPLFGYGYGLTYQDEVGVMETFSEIVQDNSERLQDLVLFENDVKTPWRMTIADQQGRSFVASSIEKNSVVTVSSFDNKVQEDARLVSFNGKGLGEIEINDNFPFDLRGYFEANSTLNVSVMVKNNPEAPIYLSMRCETDCGADLEMTEIFTGMTKNTWQDVKIDLACFKRAGATMDKIVAPFVIKSQGKYDVKFSHVMITPNTTNEKTLSCPQ